MEPALQNSGGTASEARTEDRLVKLSTDAVEIKHRFDYWVGAISEVMFSLASTSPDTTNFASHMTGATLEGLLLMNIEGSARNSFRTKGALKNAAKHTYHLMGDYRDVSAINWQGNFVSLAPGDLILTDSRYVQSGHYAHGLKGFHVKIDAGWVQRWLLYPERLVGRRIPGDIGWGRVLSTFMRSLTPELVVSSPLPQKVMADNLGSLLGLVEREVLALPGADICGARQMQESICDVIRQRASEPGLTAADVAKTLNISERTVHRALAGAKNTFAALLLRERIDIAKRMLESRNLEMLTTGEIGRRAGFGDPSYFVRAAVRNLGATPSQYREGLR
jgi:AraC family transcriptional activator of tynA and feaB